MKLSVIVPTYRRPEDLGRCLAGLKKQTRLADEVIVVVREGDRETAEFFKQTPPAGNIRIAMVNRPGQVAALNKGLEAATGDIIAFTDDDAVPHPDWLEKLTAWFEKDPKIGAAGGRDELYINGKFQQGSRKTVGKIQWCGRLVGLHHLGTGSAREVDTLKGANMSFRRTAAAGIKFDERLRGEGAQVRNDTEFCLAVQKRGWKIVYDPAARVDHFTAVRFEENKRGNFSRKAVEDGAFNETLVLMEYLGPLRRIAYVFYFLLVGNIFTPGLLQFLRILPAERGDAVLRLCAAFKGRWEGLRAWRKAHRVIRRAQRA